MLERILALAMGIAGADEKEQDLLETLCAAAEASWTARLRKSVAVEDCGEAFCCAAALPRRQTLQWHAAQGELCPLRRERSP